MRLSEIRRMVKTNIREDKIRLIDVYKTIPQKTNIRGI